MDQIEMYPLKELRQMHFMNSQRYNAAETNLVREVLACQTRPPFPRRLHISSTRTQLDH
jgi:hypothetical protein